MSEITYISIEEYEAARAAILEAAPEGTVSVADSAVVAVAFGEATIPEIVSIGDDLGPVAVEV